MGEIGIHMVCIWNPENWNPESKVSKKVLKPLTDKKRH